MEDPRLAKGVVRREVIETISPGVALADELLDSGRNNFVCAICAHRDVFGVAAADVSTGELRLSIVPPTELESLLARLSPREILVAAGDKTIRTPAERGGEGALITEREAWEFDGARAHEDLTRHFGILSLDGLGLETTRAWLRTAATDACSPHARA